MNSPDYQTLLLLVRTITVITLILFYLYNRRQPVTIRIRDVSEAGVVLNSSTLASRAKPNKRLIDGFGINNAFTTTDTEFYRGFVFRVKVQLRMQDEDWSETIRNTRNLVEGFNVNITAPQTSYSLENLVQNFVFRVVMKHFFRHLPEMSDLKVGYIASRINSVWEASKSCSKPEDLLRVKIELFDKLTNVFGLHPALSLYDDERNPLNILLPAYETLWRIVLRSLIEIHFRSHPSSQSMRQLLTEFLDDPTSLNFDKPSDDDDEISPRAMVQEALRLYPPTRRIHRFLPPTRQPFELLPSNLSRFLWGMFGYGMEMSPVNHAIDIEYLHRDPLTWGVDALEYNPKRIKTMKRQAFMPFGKGSFACPAGSTFAPMMIAICVGALVEAFPVSHRVGSESWKLIDGDGHDIEFAQGPLENGREGLPGLYLARG